MSEKEFKQIFSKKLRHYLEINGMTQAELAQKLGVGTTSVYNWCNGIKIPRMDKIDLLCDLFECRRSDLLTEDNNQEHYYLNDDAREMAQFLYDNPDYKVLFDASRKVKKEDIEFVKQMLDRFRSDE